MESAWQALSEEAVANLADATSRGPERRESTTDVRFGKATDQRWRGYIGDCGEGRRLTTRDIQARLSISRSANKQGSDLARPAMGMQSAFTHGRTFICVRFARFA